VKSLQRVLDIPAPCADVFDALATIDGLRGRSSTARQRPADTFVSIFRA
jgi:hypothetical protein